MIIHVVAKLIAHPVTEDAFVAFFVHQQQAFILDIPIGGCGIYGSPGPTIMTGIWPLSVRSE